MKREVLMIAAFTLIGCGGSSHGHGHGHGRGHGNGHGHGHRHGHGDGHGHRHGRGQGEGHGGMQHDFSDVDRFAERFDAPDRDGWQRPAEVLALLDIARGSTVADLGAGTGYFLPFLSVAAGPTGRVLALDNEPAMIEHMRRRAEREGLANVTPRAVGADDPGLEPASVDRILVVNTWHHLPDRGRYAARLREALRPGGFVLVVDFTRESPEGPPPDARVPAETVATELGAGGLAAEVVAGEQLGWQYAVRGTRRE